jgi:hypothetical protein
LILADGFASIKHWDFKLAQNMQAVYCAFNIQRFLINILQEARTKLTMNFNCTFDNTLCDRVFWQISRNAL